MARRGKFLVIRLNSSDRIIPHLRMTGCLLLTPADYPKEKHTHIIFQLSNDMELRFSDTRRFGRFWMLKKDEADTYSGIGKLGADPLGKLLAAAIPERISFFIDANKITPEEYLETRGRNYRNTPYLQVYGRSGKPCPKCGETLCRTVVGGRSSVYCPVCQRNLGT